jgi:hypothetical protein
MRDRRTTTDGPVATHITYTPYAFVAASPHTCAALLTRRAKRNNVLLPDTKMPSWPVEVKMRCWPRHAQPRKVRPCAICITLQATTTATAPLACFWQGRKRDPFRGLIGEKGGTPFALRRIFTNPVCNYQSHFRVRAEETFAPTYVTDVEAQRL